MWSQKILGQKVMYVESRKQTKKKGTQTSKGAEKEKSSNKERKQTVPTTKKDEGKAKK